MARFNRLRTRRASDKSYRVTTGSGADADADADAGNAGDQ